MHTGKTDTNACAHTNKPVEHRARVTITQRREHEAMQEFSKENSKTEKCRQTDRDGHTQSRYTRMEKTDVYSWVNSMKRRRNRGESDNNMLSGCKNTAHHATWFSLLWRGSVKFLLKGYVYHFWDKLTSKAWGSGWHYTLWITGNTAYRTFLTEFISNTAWITAKTNSRGVKLTDPAFHLPGR